jgi:hypothetical protein
MKEFAEFLTRSVDGEEAGEGGVGPVGAGDGLESAEIEGENEAGGSRGGGVYGKLLWGEE